MKKLIFALLLICSVALASAGLNYNNYTIKWEMCLALNLTTTACDSWWGMVADFPQNVTTIYSTNWTEVEKRINETLDERMKNYYDKEEVYSKTESYNRSEIDAKNFSEGFSFEYYTNEDRGTGERLMTEKDTKELLDEYSLSLKKNGTGDGIWGIIGAVILIIIFGGVYGYSAYSKNKEQAGYKNPAKKLVPEIPSRILPLPSKIPSEKQEKSVSENKGQNEWTQLVKQVQQERGISYKEAMKEAKKIYEKK